MLQDFTGGTQVLGDLLFSIKLHLHDLFVRGCHRVDETGDVSPRLGRIHNRFLSGCEVLEDIRKEQKRIDKKNLAIFNLNGRCPDKRLSIEGKVYYADRTTCDW